MIYYCNNKEKISEEDINENSYHIYEFTNIPVIYNTSNNLCFAIDTENGIEQLNKLKGVNGIDINYLYEFVYYSSIFHVIYEYLLSLYNKYYYTFSTEQLFLSVIKQIYYKLTESYDTLKNTRLYIPGSFKFNYVVNDNNELNIYYFNTFNVLYVDDSCAPEIEKDVLNKEFIIFYETTNDVKIVSYNINIEYNTQFADIINNINVHKIYTYPYIDKLDNYWIVNDDNSNILSYNNLDSIHKFLIFPLSQIH